MAMQKSDWIWMNGEFVRYDDANIHVLSHGLHYGLGIFEGIRAYAWDDGQSAIFKLDEHMKRFMNSAKLATLPLSYSQAELTEAVLETCSRNKLKSCYIRPIAFSGFGQLGVAALNNPTEVAIAAWPWGAYLGDESLENGVSVKISSYARPHVNSQLHLGKVTGHYINSILAKREALMDGYSEAILLDTDGYVAEASGENIFAVIDGVLYATQFAGPMLGGITRGSLMAMAKDMGISVREERLTRDMLYMADEVFMCGTAAEVTPVSKIDQRAIGEGGRGPLTEKLQTRFFEVMRGQHPQYENWFAHYAV